MWKKSSFMDVFWLAIVVFFGDMFFVLGVGFSFSRVVFCDDVGISLSALSMYETGQRIPRDEIKLKIARRLNTSIESLFFTM